MHKSVLKDVEAEIFALKDKLKDIEPYIKNNASLAIVYNRTLVEKAILINKYKELLNKQNLNKKIKNLIKIGKKEKRICDFFFGPSI